MPRKLFEVEDRREGIETYWSEGAKKDKLPFLVIEYKATWAISGDLIALCPTKEAADQIAKALNIIDDIKKELDIHA